MKNKDNVVISMYLHGRPNLLEIFSKWVDGYFTKKSDSYIDWRRNYLKALGVNINSNDDWDEEDYYEGMANWYEENLDDDCYWNPSPSDDDYDDWYEGDCVQMYPPNKRKGKNGKYKHEKGNGCRVVDINDKSHGKKRGNCGNDYDGAIDDYSFEESCYKGTKDIYYYDDYTDRLSFLRFKSIPQFKVYCEKRGITIPKEVLDMMKYRYVSHCCVNKNILLSEKRMLLEAEESYGSMVYSAATSEDIDNMGENLNL